jgi:hypothetical protein
VPLAEPPTTASERLVAPPTAHRVHPVAQQTPLRRSFGDAAVAASFDGGASNAAWSLRPDYDEEQEDGDVTATRDDDDDDDGSRAARRLYRPRRVVPAQRRVWGGCFSSDKHGRDIINCRRGARWREGDEEAGRRRGDSNSREAAGFCCCAPSSKARRAS